MTSDLTGTRERSSASELLADCIHAARSEPNRHTFVATSFDQATEVARSVDAMRQAGRAAPALAGLAISVKDLFDMQGDVTRAGSVVLASNPPATADSPAVARLRQAGAAFIGRSNMSEFAFSGIGINPHYGTPSNPVTARLDLDPRIPGGSTSGGAVSVATGAAWAALGSDTAGSIRIPAALQGLVGFKNTARLTPTEGAVPLSTTLDTVCAITRSVRDAVLLHELLAARQVSIPAKPISEMRFALPTTLMLDQLDATVARAFERSIAALRVAGARIEEIALPMLSDVPASFSPPEAWAWHRRLLAVHESSYDPRVAVRIRRGELLSAADYIDLLQACRAWMERMTAAIAGFDALLSPTVPIVAPPLAPLLVSDDAFFATNALLLRNPGIVNMLDGCGLSLPCHSSDEMPVGLMVWGGALCDDTVLGASLAIETVLTKVALRMKVAVIGAGVIGVTTAHELVADGHEVAVFERRGGVAAEASFANAGVVAPGYVTPWAAPGMPGKALRHLLSRHAPVRLHARLSGGEIAWIWRWWRACRLRTYQDNRLRMQRLACFSRERLHRVTRELKLDYERTEGYLVLLRTAKDLAMAQPGLASLTELKTRFETLDAARCRIVEPGLSDETPLHAGIYLPDDEAGNCRQFTALLRTEAQRAGVRFRFHTDVQKIIAGKTPQLVHRYAPPHDSTVLLNVVPENIPADSQDTEPMPLQAVTESFDAVVVCAALGAKTLLRPHGLALPMQAVYGYSVTAPLRRLDAHGDIGPRSAVMDERYKVAISRLGARVRVAGSAEVGGVADRHDPRALETLYKVLHDWFPGCARLSQAQVWKGARPMLPDGPPVLGPSGVAGIWLNLGHGSSGWALSCGSARLLADAIAGRAPPIDIEGLGVERLQD